MQLINFAKFVALVAIATPVVAQPIDRSALEARTITAIRASPVMVKTMKREETAAVEAVRPTIHDAAAAAALAPRMDPISIATIATTGVKAIGGVFKGIKNLIQKKKAKKQQREQAASSESASAKRDLADGAAAAVPEDPVSLLIARAFDVVGLTNGIAQGAQAIGQIIQTFKDMKKGGRSKPGADAGAGAAAGAGAGAGAAAAPEGAAATEETASDESASPSTASDDSSSSSSASDESASPSTTSDESSSETSASDASGYYKKRTTVVKRAVVWSA